MPALWSSKHLNPYLYFGDVNPKRFAIKSLTQIFVGASTLFLLWAFTLPAIGEEKVSVLHGAESWSAAVHHLQAGSLSTPGNDTIDINQSDLWLHVDISESQSDILYFPKNILDRYRVYSFVSDVPLFDSGPRNTNAIAWNPRTKISLRRNWGTHFLLNVEATAAGSMPYQFLSLEEYEQLESPGLINIGMYYGGIVLMSALSLLLSFFNRDPDAWKLSIALISWFLPSFAIWGYGTAPLPYNLHELLAGITNQLIVVASFTGAWFTIHFLNSSAGHTLIFKALKLCIWLHPAYLIGAFIFGINWAISLGIVLFAAILGTLTAVVASLHKDRAARYLVASSVCSATPFIFVWFKPMTQQSAIAVGILTLAFIMFALMHRVGERFHALGRQAKVASERERFLASMSHEIRTPLNGIIGFSELCSQEDLEGDVKHYFHQIDRSSKMLLGIVNDVLDYSKLQAADVNLVSEPMSIRRTLEDVITVNKPFADLNGISLGYEIAENVSDYLVTDPFRCAQILINLCGNAVKFSRHGEVKIKVFRDKGEIFFQVVDNGIGIDQDVLASLFNPFSQADASTARKFGGTGLGLAISKQLCELMGGDLSAISEKGQGSTFTLRLPYREGSEPDVAPVANVDKLVGKKVLLAEDNPVNLLLATRILEKNGLNIDAASDGKIALEKATRNDYDFILMDMQMPELSGTQTTEKIRELGFRCPIIAMTANTSESDRNACIQAGMDDYLAKPIEQQQLLKKLEQWSNPQ